MKRSLHTLLLVLACSVFATGQAGSTIAPDSHPSESGGSNMIEGSVRMGASYIDNVSGSNGTATPDYRYALIPSLDWNRQTPRLDSLLSVTPALTISQNQPQHDQFAPSFGANISYRWTPRLTVSVKNKFTMTNNPFEDVSTRSNLPQFGPIDNPNQSVVTPFASRINELAGVDASYLINERTAAGIGGVFTLVDFRDVPHTASTSPTLISSNTVTGRAYLMRHATARHWLGMEYDYSNHQAHRTFFSRTATHTALLFDQFTIRPNIHLALFAGPEYSQVQDQLALDLFNFVIFLPVTRSGLSYAVGGNLDWVNNHTDLQAQYVHRAGDGGGIIGSVLLNQVSADVRQHLTPRWAVLVSGAYGRSDALSVTSTFAGTRTSTAGAGISYQLRSDLIIDGQYFYSHQQRVGASGSGLVDRNRVAITMQYQFQHPIRR